MKQWFRILLLAPEYNLDIQARIPVTLCAIHNFIHIHDPGEGTILEERDLHNQDDHIHEVAEDLEELEQRTGMAARRDQIAYEMWEDYQQILAERDDVIDHSEEGEDFEELLEGADELEDIYS